MSNVSRFWDTYKERHVAHKTDSYLTFFEYKLDQLALAIKPVQTFESRLDTVETQLQRTEAKVDSLTQLVKLQQTYLEEQEVSQPRPVMPLQFEIDLLQLQRTTADLAQQLTDLQRETSAATSQVNNFSQQAKAQVAAVERQLQDALQSLQQDDRLTQERCLQYTQEAVSELASSLRQQCRSDVSKTLERTVERSVERAVERITEPPQKLSKANNEKAQKAKKRKLSQAQPC